MAKKIEQLEAKSQKLFFKTLENYYPNIRQLTFAIPNGGFRTTLEAFHLKLEGVTAGIPDIFCAYAANGYHGLFIEMKKPVIKGAPKASVSPAQRIMIPLLEEQGYLVKVCYGSCEALDAILSYWNMTSQ